MKVRELAEWLAEQPPEFEVIPHDDGLFIWDGWEAVDAIDVNGKRT